MAKHAILSPSGASRWGRCPGSVALTKDIEDDRGSEHAAEGTAAHELGEMCLTEGNDAVAYLGRIIEADGFTFEVDDEMAGQVQKYVDFVRGLGGELMVEQRLPITPITGEPDAFGTSDSVVFLPDGEMCIVDLKYGRGVKVDAEENEQLAIYALAAIEEFGFAYDIKSVRLVIVQPRLDHISEWVLPMTATGNDPSIRGFRTRIAKPCERAVELLNGAETTAADFNPGEKQCRWCKAKATCPALRDEVASTVAVFTPATPEEFADMGTTDPSETQAFDNQTEASESAWLSACMQKVDLIEGWCKAVRAEVERRLLVGQAVPGFKVVEGRRGAHQWTDPVQAEELLKSFRLKTEEMYDLKLISPTTADKLAKAKTIGPRQWPKLQELIAQAEGRPSVAPESDKRPALVMTAAVDDFADETVDDLV